MDKKSLPVAFVVALLIVGCLVWYAAQSQPTAATRPAPAAPPTPNIRVFRGRFDHCVCWEVTNMGRTPVTINRVRFNGEYTAKLAKTAGDDMIVMVDPPSSGPVTLTIGESALYYEGGHTYGGERPEPYGKEVIFVDITTPAGTWRH